VTVLAATVTTIAKAALCRTRAMIRAAALRKRRRDMAISVGRE
jgi:hypothetical protein